MQLVGVWTESVILRNSATRETEESFPSESVCSRSEPSARIHHFCILVI